MPLNKETKPNLTRFRKFGNVSEFSHIGNISECHFVV